MISKRICGGVDYGKTTFKNTLRGIRARRLRMVLGPSTSFCSQLLYNVSCFTTSIALQNCLCSPDYRPLLYGVETHTKRPDPQRSKLIAQKLLIMSFCKSQLPHTSVNLFCISVILKDKLTELTFAKQLHKHPL